MIRIKSEDYVFEFTIIFRYWFSKKQYCQTCGFELFHLRPQENTYTCLNHKCQHVRMPVIRIDP